MYNGPSRQGIVPCHKKSGSGGGGWGDGSSRYSVNIQEVFHVYLNKFENDVTHLFLVILGNN